MKYLALTVFIPKDKAAQFARSLEGSASVIGASLTNQFDEECESWESRVVITFTFSAHPVLTPEQFTALMALCQISRASIVALHYDAGDDEDESAEHEPPQPQPATRQRRLELVVDNSHVRRKP